MEVSKNIRLLRDKKGLTQVDMANRMGTERSNYARLENRDVNLTLKQIQEIADALEVSVYEIIGMPQAEDLKGEQTEKIRRLEERLKMTEDALKEKKKNIKLYKSFIVWVRNMIKAEFFILTLGSATSSGILNEERLENLKAEELRVEDLDFTEDELRKIGDSMFYYDYPYTFLAAFIAKSGFVTDKWFINAYKRAIRGQEDKMSLAEVRNWVNSVFEFLEEE